MGSIRDIRSTPQDVMLDIDAELRHWRASYRQSAFHRSTREFDDYIPTLKFGYDVYLLNYRHDLDTLMSNLRQRYERTVPEWQRLDWPLSEAIVRETWKRMRSGDCWQPVTHLPATTRALASA
ncbi:hypothetical protein [Pseudoxanthomonas gei]|nr:hypothetical protein [Pseudoxanthomonas gei]